MDDGIVLERAEFLVLLDAVGATAVIGIDPKELFPASPAEHRELLLKGHELLKQRGLLKQRDDGTLILDQDLFALALIVAYPQVALISVRDLPGRGRQLFIHYQVDNFVVEQTLPSVSQHRLATIPALPALFERLGEIFPLHGETEDALFTMPAPAFLEVKDLAEQRQDAAAHALLLAHGCVAESANLLIEAIQQPEFSGTVALVRYVERQIVDARNPALLQGPQAAWLFVPAPTDTPVFSIRRASVATLRKQFIALFSELSPRPETP